MSGFFTKVKVAGLLLFVIIIMLIILLPYIGVFLPANITSGGIILAIFLIFIGRLLEGATSK